MSVGGDGVLGPALQHVQGSSHRLHLIGVVEVSNLFLSTQGRNLQKVKRRGASNVQIQSLKIKPNLKVCSHLAAPLEDILDHVLPLSPHLVALFLEVFTEPHPVHLVRAEGSGLQWR